MSKKAHKKVLIWIGSIKHNIPDVYNHLNGKFSAWSIIEKDHTERRMECLVPFLNTLSQKLIIFMQNVTF